MSADLLLYNENLASSVATLDLPEVGEVEESKKEKINELLVPLLRDAAVQTILSYFRKKKDHSGRWIPRKVLLCDRYVNMVMNLQVGPNEEGDCGADIIHSMLNMSVSEHEQKQCERRGQLSPDVKHVIYLYKRCALADVPQTFASGIIIMELELCEGYKTVEY